MARASRIARAAATRDLNFDCLIMRRAPLLSRRCAGYFARRLIGDIFTTAREVKHLQNQGAELEKVRAAAISRAIQTNVDRALDPAGAAQVMTTSPSRSCRWRSSMS